MDRSDSTLGSAHVHTDHPGAGGDADIGRIGALIGDRTRSRVLLALLDGRALPASVLAAEAGVTPATISEHLGRLREANLLMAEQQGRARYYRLASPAVAEAVEALARISPPEPIRSLRQGTRAHALRRARTCYHHVAGKLGVAVMAAMIERGQLGGGDGKHHPELADADRLSAPGSDVDYRLTPLGRRELAALDIDLDVVDGQRAPIRYCLDWSEQRHHLAGPLGAALTDRMIELDWLRRIDATRVLRITELGLAGLQETFGLAAGWDN